MEKLEIFIRVSCQFFVVNGPIFEEIFGGDVKMTFYSDPSRNVSPSK